MSDHRKKKSTPRHLRLSWIAVCVLALSGCHPFESADGEFPDLAEQDTTAGDTGGVDPGDGVTTDVDAEPDQGSPGDAGVDAVADGQPGDVGSPDVEPGDLVDAGEVCGVGEPCPPMCEPGAEEICGDGVDNDCDGVADPQEQCAGLGTFVSALLGDDNNPGTQEAPVATVGQAMLHASSIGEGTDIYVAEGNYAEKIVLSIDGTSLLGGYECNATSCVWQRDPSAFVTTLQAVDMKGLVVDSGITSQTRIDGFTIRGLSGAITDGNAMAAVTIERGTPTVANNLIYGGDLEGCPGGWCVTTGVRVLGPSSDGNGVPIHDNKITGGRAELQASSAVQLVAQANDGTGSPVVRLERNRLYGGAARWTRALDAFGSAPGTRIVDNDIHAGDQLGEGAGTSFAVIASGQPLIDRNRINADPSLVGACSTPEPTGFCGGVELEGSRAVLTNNVIFGMPAPRSVAVFMTEGEVEFDAVTLNANTLDGGAGEVMSAALACRTTFGTRSEVGRIRNNALIAGQGLSRYAMYEDSHNQLPCHAEVFEYNAIWFPTADTDPDRTDVAYRRFDNGVSQDLSDPNGPTFANDNTVVEEPRFTDYPGDLHLLDDSPLIDAGTPSEAPDHDLDGDPRPAPPVGDGLEAIDIGADEVG